MHLLSQVLWYHASRREWQAAIKAFDGAPETAQGTVYNLTARGRAAQAVTFLERSYTLDPLDEWTVDLLFEALFRAFRSRRSCQIIAESRQVQKQAGVEEPSVRDFRRNLRWRSGKGR